MRAEGGLTPNPEKAGNELRLHSNRLAAARMKAKNTLAVKEPALLSKRLLTRICQMWLSAG